MDGCCKPTRSQPILRHDEGRVVIHRIIQTHSPLLPALVNPMKRQSPLVEKGSLIGLIRFMEQPMLEKVPLIRLKAAIWDE
ncbi:hypothetical protein AMQ84_24015 [Paenibacillus riograndensis]|uniref:Uncharacterized protein n=1 Tax=Paenibacillus riograndensis TaxID=483937 RepID=A0A132TNM0_9BACL|nr:hypothetical protein AMQ84_24015 [Paenibacillus riograndensis]